MSQITLNERSSSYPYTGTILVIGGGPSALSDLDRIDLRQHAPEAVISVNDHGFKPGVPGWAVPDYIVCNDDIHSETRQPMAPRLRRYGVPIISRHWWADIRETDPRGDTNSGMTALIVGALLGACPVIGVGFDCWQGERTYFHDWHAKAACMGRALYDVMRQAQRIPQAVGIDAPIRPVSGPLTALYPAYDHEESFGPYQEIDAVRRARAVPTIRTRVTAGGAALHGGVAPHGTELALSPEEYRRLRLANAVEDVRLHGLGTDEKISGGLSDMP